jgi:WD40 repeat protein/tRNA A-37 threonylcarbamoyl transferase component Bud32
MISFSCPHCGRGLKAKEPLAGRSLRCPGCQQAVTVPAAAPPDHQTIPAPPLPEEEATVPPPPGNQGAAGPTPRARPDLLALLAPPQAPGEIGRLGGHGVLEVLGAGGMGVVFKARDPQLERLVALKAMLPSLASASARQRFLREARAAAAVKHDHVVTIHQVGEDRGAPFLAMELLEGEPLDSRLRREGKLAVGEVLRVGREAAEALQAAHEQGLIHRDIKPANLFLEGRRGRVKVLDFGLARASQQDRQLTQDGAIVGTPAYMSPEQAQGQPVDARTDLFSLGCVLYHACTGEQPFRGSDTISTLMAVVTEQPRPPHEVNPLVPVALSELVMRLLAKKPADRPADASTVAGALAEMAGDRTERVSPLRPLTGGAGGRRRLLLGAAGLGALAVVVIGLVVLWHRGGGPRENDGPDQGKGGRLAAGGDTEPLSRVALVTRPAALRPEVKAWTIETKLPRRSVRALAFHPTDGTLAAGGDDHAIRIYDARTGELRRIILAEQRAGSPNAGLLALAWSPDGKELASGGGDLKVRLWDAASGRVVQSFEGHTGAVNCLAWSPDGKMLAAGDEAGRVHFWDPGAGKHLEPINPGVGPVDSLAWSAGGKWLAISSRAGHHTIRKLCVWTPGVGRTHFQPGGASPTWGASAEDRWVLASAEWDRISFWDADKGKPAGEVRPWSSLDALAYSPAGKLLASAGGNSVRIWSSPERKEVRSWKANLSGSLEARTLTWSPDGKTVAYADLLGISLRDAAGDRSLQIPVHGSWVQGGSLSPDRTGLATLQGNLVKVWDIPGARWRRNLEHKGVWYRLLAWSYGDLVAAAGRRWGGNAMAVLFAAPSGKRLDDKEIDVSSLSWSPNGERLLLREVVGGGPRFGLVVRGAANFKQGLQAPNRFHPAPAHKRPGLAAKGPLAWSPDSKTVAGRAADRAELVRLWSVPGGELRDLPGHKGPVQAVAFSPRADLLASGSNDSTIGLWDLKGGRKIEPLKGHAGPVVGLSWAPGGATLASTGEDGTLRLWDAATGNQRHVRTKGSEAPGPLRWATDGKRIAARQGGLLRIWDAETGKVLHEMAAVVPLHLLEWSRDDRDLVAGRSDGRVDLWNPATGKLRCTLVNLRNDQWLTVGPDGHYDGPPGIESELVYVVQTESGQETLSPQQFAEKYQWKNDPQRVRTAP